MAQKRGLGDAARDPLVRKEKEPERLTTGPSGGRKTGKGALTALVAAAVLAGFVGGWFARRIFRFL